ncbi:hypothetical protein AEB_P1930 [Altererythrobacter sp. B11]|uniref:efflux RND transporter periplasmic adaptor subunit n=1 Tax=Altererythrobacter sp. B11 TaxID=2060312 RepID=UPI000DC72234|nr:efflux RND transporter periplasmic adaptor subunit [Altererythrobacter sp. B11]BBC72798.1 hypothetical protein AEB_P1930 [Altererythrobacter sp. B11]
MTDPVQDDQEVDALLGSAPGGRWRRWVLVLVVLGGLFALAILAARFVSGGHAALYESDLAQMADLHPTLSAPGILQPMIVRPVGASREGVVARLLVSPGARVARGQVLAMLDAEAARGELDRGRALRDEREQAAGRAQAALNAARQKLALFESVRERSHGLAPSAEEMTSARMAVERAATELEAANVELAAAHDQIVRAERDLAATEIVAPIAGVIQSRSAQPGQRVGGSATGSPLFTIAAPYERLRLEVAPEPQGGERLAANSPVGVAVRGQPGRFAAQVDTILPTGTPAEQPGAAPARRFVLTVANRAGLLRPGLPAEAHFVLPPRQGVLAIPEKALAFARAADAQRPDSEGTAVYVLDSDGSPRRVQVELGMTDGTLREIRAGNIQRGDRVILGLR